MFIMKNKITAILSFAFLLLAATGLHADAALDALLYRVDAAVSFAETDLSAEYQIVSRSPGGGSSSTVATMFRRDRTNQYLILILEPVIDKGKGYLKEGDTLWLYDPVGRVFTFTSAKERFQNSGARNSDFSRSNYSEDYRAVSSTKEKLGAFSCTVLSLEARTDKASFPKVKIWVSDGDDLVRKIEDYSLSGQLMRSTAIPSYQKVGNRWLPVSLVILDHLKSKTVAGKTEYERTTVSIKAPSLKALPDYVYTKEYLERVAR